MMNSILKERYSALFLFLFGLALWFYLPYDITVEDRLSTLGPAFFPKFIAVTVMVLSAGIILKTFVKKKEAQTSEEQKGTEGQRIWAAVAVFILMFLYVFVIEWLGYLISTIIIMSLILWVLSSRKWYHYAILIAFVVLIQYVFENIMYVQLP